jgi:hypothetical protein
VKAEATKAAAEAGTVKTNIYRYGMPSAFGIFSMVQLVCYRLCCILQFFSFCSSFVYFLVSEPPDTVSCCTHNLLYL